MGSDDDRGRTPAGLWLPGAPALLTHRPRSRTVTLRDGRRALITVDDSGTVQHTESSLPGTGVSNRLDAVVRPKTVTIKILPRQRG